MEIDYIRVYQETPPLSIENEKLNELNVFPNPFDNSIQLYNFHLTNKSVQVNIYSINGTLVYAEQDLFSLSHLKIDDLDFLSSGIYQVQLLYGDEVYHYKIVKE